jgi:hypothetical protein
VTVGLLPGVTFVTFRSSQGNLNTLSSTAHASSSYACAQDEYFKRPHTTSIDGDKRLDSGWILVGFGVGGRLTRDLLGVS